MRLLLFVICGILSASTYAGTSVKVLDKELLEHPRLLFVEAEREHIDTLWGKEPLLDSLRIFLLKEAEISLNVPLPVFSLKDFNYASHMLAITGKQVYRMVTLCMAYRLTGDIRFASKAEKELLNACSFPTWNPSHYLDVSEMTTAVAIGYDWLYDVLAEDTKRKIVAAIKTKALDEAVKAYETGDKNSWAKRETNWNVVCNSGMVIGAVAIAEHYPELCGKIIRNSLKYLPNCLNHFAPDGVCYEGPGYWGYTNIYLTLLLKTLYDNFKSDFGLSEMPGIAQTVRYYIRSLSPSGRIFNFANTGGTMPATNPIYFFFSKHFNQPDVALYYRNFLQECLAKQFSANAHFFLAIPWFDRSSPQKNEKEKKLLVFNGVNDIVVFNGNKKNENAIYLTAKTGRSDMAHQQLDVGTFIVETNGIRWSDDLGADNYYLPGFWDYKPDGMRWNYFRNTNFSHNVLSIDNRLQYSQGTGDLVSFDDKSEQPYVTMDLSPVYPDQASSVRRTFSMLGDDVMQVVDSVELKSGTQSLCWSMITGADVQLYGNVAVLSKDGKTFYLEIQSPVGFNFSVKTAEPYSLEEKPVKEYRILSATVKGLKTPVVKIIMTGNEKYLTYKVQE